MTNILFYCGTILIWGSTWLAIKYQLGSVPTAWSVTYRFALAAVILILWCIIRKRSLRFSITEHGYIALQGICLFALNYQLFYLAELHITSGLAAVAFSTIIVMNLINGRIFLGTPVEKHVLTGGGAGLAGLILLFWPELAAVNFSSEVIKGTLLCFAATYLASLGNILSARNQQRKLPIIQSNALGMSYGCICMALIAWLSGTPVIFDLNPAYLFSLAYLALFGSVIAFGCYLSLIGRIGASKAAYATLFFPLVALLLSTFFENYRWTFSGFIGIAMILCGNFLVLGLSKGKKIQNTEAKKTATV
jgi:drug/metabolite transporter (DMT)-like permease